MAHVTPPPRLCKIVLKAGLAEIINKNSGLLLCSWHKTLCHTYVCSQGSELTRRPWNSCTGVIVDISIFVVIFWQVLGRLSCEKCVCVSLLFWLEICSGSICAVQMVSLVDVVMDGMYIPAYILASRFVAHIRHLPQGSSGPQYRQKCFFL